MSVHTSHPTQEEVVSAIQIAESNIIIDANEKLTNAEKYNYVKNFINLKDKSILEEIPLIYLYTLKNMSHVQAGMYLCDLRVQYYSYAIANANAPAIEYHKVWLINKQWYVKFREYLRISQMSAENACSGGLN